MHCQNLSLLMDRLEQNSFGQKYKSLNKAICEMVEEFGLVSFLTLAIEDKESILSVIKAIDQAIGYLPNDFEAGSNIFDTAQRLELWGQSNQEIGERYLLSEDVDPALVSNVKLNPAD